MARHLPGLSLADCVLVAVVRSALSALRQYWRLRHIPGPPSAGWSKWWLVRAVASGRVHLDVYEVCQKYSKPISVTTGHGMSVGLRLPGAATVLG